MKAVIMAGGEGTRLRPLTLNVPKPMLPIANRPMMEHIVTLLRSHGITEIVVTVAYLANTIRTYFGDGSEFGVRMVYATEDTPLGTAGSVRNAMEELDERFLVISGDVLTDIDLSAIIESHESKNAMATIGLVRVENPLEFGIVITKEDGSIERFLEKPTWGQVFSDTINTGIFVLEPEIFDYIAPEGPVDFSSDVFPALLADDKPLFGAVAEGYWEDVGTLDAYGKAHQDILDEKVKVHVEGFEISHGVWLGEGAEVHPEAVVAGSAIIGDSCRIDADVHIGEYTVLGSNVRIRAGSELERTVVHDNVYIGEGVRLHGAIIGRGTDLRRGSRCDVDVVVGDQCFIGEDAVISSGVKVFPFKTVESGAIINTSIVWESRGARRLFSQHGVTGLANVDVTPELATRVAMAFATTLKKGSTVVTSRDSSRTGRMLKRAMMAGLNSSGINVVDLEVAPVPVTRFLIRTPQYFGGLTIRLEGEDAQGVLIRFFDSAGLDVSESVQRKVERLVNREDYRRVLAGEIGDIDFPARTLERYSVALEDTVDLAAIRDAKFKLVVDYTYGSTSLVMPSLLSKLGADVLGVNPYISTLGVVHFDPVEHSKRVAELVVASEAHLGVILDPDGEHLTLIDDRGHRLSDSESLFVFLKLISGRLSGQEIALPVSASSAAHRIVEQAGATVRSTKTANSALMETAELPGVGFAANSEGGFILPRFLPAFDASAAFMKMLELLALEGRPMSDLVAELPRSNVVHDTVVTPWDRKGMVMRSLVEQTQELPVELIDGVKVFHDDTWVLALPDVSEPVTHLWAEAANKSDSRDLLREYARRIGQLVR